MLVHRRVTPQYFVAGTHLYTWVERETMWSKVDGDGQDQASNHRPSDLKSNTTTAPLHLHFLRLPKASKFSLAIMSFSTGYTAL